MTPLMMSNVAKPMESEFFPVVRPQRGWSLSWTWLTSKSKCLGSSMFAKPTSPWTWLTIKSRCRGLG